MAREGETEWERGWLIGFYPQGPRKGIFVSSEARVYPPTHILSDQGDPLVVRQHPDWQ